MTTPDDGAQRRDLIAIAPAILHREDTDRPDIVAELYVGYTAEGDQLRVMRDGPFTLAYSTTAEERANPWSACIWPGHQDGEQRSCATDTHGWCRRRYPTKQAAARSLHLEYDRRRATQAARDADTAAADQAALTATNPAIDPSVAAADSIAQRVVALHRFQDLLRAEAELATDKPDRRAGLLRAARLADSWAGRILRGQDSDRGPAAVLDDLAEQLRSDADGAPDRGVAAGLSRAATLAHDLRSRLTTQ